MHVLPSPWHKVVKSSGGLILPLADFGGLWGPAGGLADWRTLPGGLWRTGELLADFWRTLADFGEPEDFWRTLADFGGLLADSGGLLADIWRTSGFRAGFWRTGPVVLPFHARFLATPREGHNSSVSVSFFATPREDHNGQSGSQSAASSHAFPGGHPGGHPGGLLADFWRTSGGLLADFWRT
eukprot:gene14976-biopygen11360